MTSHILHILLFLLSLAFGVSSCSNLDEGATDTPSTQPPGAGDAGSDGDTLTIAQAQRCIPGQYVMIKGYVVGYVDGTTMSKAVFGAPTQKANTNIILADSRVENDYKKCLPVQLKTGSDEQMEYNLLAFPQQLGMSVFVQGEVTTYFKVNGFKYPNFWIETLADDETTSPPAADAPNTPPDTPSESAPVSATPTLDPIPQTNIYGR